MGAGAAVFQRPVTGSLRILQGLFGLTALAAAFFVWIFPGLAIITLIALLGVGLVMVGFVSIASGALRHLPRELRVVRILFGILDVILAVVALVYPAFGVDLLVALLALALVFDGAGHVTSAANRRVPGWSRALGIGVGFLSLLLAILVFALPALGVLLLLVLLSVALAFSGAKGLADAIAGVQWVLVPEPARKPSG
jgi:uncharacterized membrane protein HdeD (DUF308 family)